MKQSYLYNLISTISTTWESKDLAKLYLMIYCYIVGLGLNCKFIDLLFKHSVLKFIEISSFIVSLVSEIIYTQTDTLTEELMDLR